MSTHTPGEWWLNPDGDEFCADPTVEGPNGPIATIHHITRIVGEGQECRVEYGHFEDGYLIAAAPTLLAACEGLIDVFGYLEALLPNGAFIPILQGIDWRERLATARAAVAKTKGESA